ncbi:hypothetical protein HZS54_13610 [Halosimplex pelagicum]|uniref:Uncharacterized protein n=1 Tax=Halosimplex pelagicum TaxID=869886 RepID=A0A7D5TJJ3_9EURY|nr:hypothetical protein HZS54_13610 [Halosimplex pelagicum]
MIEWFGGEGNVVDILIPLFGICVLLLAPKVTDTNRSRRYFVPAFASWFGLQLLIGLEQGTLVSFPHPIGLVGGLLLLIGFVGLIVRGLFAAWKGRESSAPPSR